MKADKPEFGGCITFDGNIQVSIPNHGIKTRCTDLGGLKLRRQTRTRKLLVLTRNHVGYDEIDTGYIVRTKNYDDGKPPYFGLKDNPDAENWGCHNYCDVIAWGLCRRRTERPDAVLLVSSQRWKRRLPASDTAPSMA